ncbi:MAG: alpha/beta hydrolase [Verrucomicrobiales bacterium]|jgi:pimeloyl-ACP methyl ester carboxylesterase|nr:alpha/beta hydrolase [Verrucomicrobiales bacterium]
MCEKVKLLLSLTVSAFAASLTVAESLDYKYNAPDPYMAEFRLRLPAADGEINYTLVLLPGYNGDGRGMADEAAWQRLADEQRCAILACRLVNNKGGSAPHYVRVENWSGKALLDTLKHFAAQTQKLELATAPLLLWGHSAGGGFAYNFANWKPERVAGFVLVKSALNTNDPRSAMLKVPALFIGGENDRERTELITERYTAGRRGAARCGALPSSRTAATRSGKRRC